MKIYFSHPKNIDYKPIYELLDSLKEYEFILPYRDNEKPLDSSSLIKGKNCDMIFAEVTLPSTGQGVELGWANQLNLPIICFHKKDNISSRSLKFIAKEIFEYDNLEDLSIKIKKVLND